MFGPKPNLSTTYGYDAPMTSATINPTKIERGENSRMSGGFWRDEAGTYRSASALETAKGAATIAATGGFRQPIHRLSRRHHRHFLSNMHPRIAQLLDYIDRQADALRAEFEAIPPERRSIRPAPDRWSPAEVVHHVAIVEQRLVKRLQSLIEQARAFAPETDSSSVFKVVDTGRVEIRAQRFKTSELSEPRDTDAARVWTEFESARRELKDVIQSADGLSLREVSAPHPALGPLSGYGWIAFAGSHAARHAAQIKEDAASA